MGIKVDYEKFIQTWYQVKRQDGSYADVARLHGINQELVSNRRMKLRKIGVLLPDLRRSNVLVTRSQQAKLQQIADREAAASVPVVRGATKNLPPEGVA